MFKEAGIDAVILPNPIDSPFMQHVEQKNEGLKFLRIDADVNETFKDAEESRERPRNMTGTVLFSTTVRIRPAPPLGIRTSRYPFIRMNSLAVSWLVSSIREMASSGIPSFFKPFLIAVTMALLDSSASLPPRRITAFPVLKQLPERLPEANRPYFFCRQPGAHRRTEPGREVTHRWKPDERPGSACRKHLMPGSSVKCIQKCSPE